MVTPRLFLSAVLCLAPAALAGGAGDLDDAGVAALDGGADSIVQPGLDIASLSLEDLLAQPIEVTSRRGESAREAAGIVTVLTREEIIASGARDLSDLLWLVPGFSQNLDVENVAGLSVRGVWSYEGKVLLMVDGVDMTELLYGVNPLGLHYLTGNMERLEIIRGPGSAVYGGNAGMAVISVITRGAKELQGGQVEARYGQLSRTYSDRSVGLGIGHTFDVPGALGVSLTAALGQGNRSEGTYTAPSGDAWPLADGRGASLSSSMVNLGVTWRGLKARFLYDSYAIGSIDGMGALTTVTRDGEAQAAPNDNVFRTIAGDLRYTFQLSDTFSLEPRLSYKHQLPWWTSDPNAALYYEKMAERFSGGLTATWAATSHVHLLGGLEAFLDGARVLHPTLIGTGSQTDFAALNSANPNFATMQNAAVFAQVQWDNPVVNLTAGGRAELHSLAGPSLVPRLAATRRFDRLTTKLLFSGAFRAPSFENLNIATSGQLAPERIWVGEAEVSCALTEWAYASVNGYVLRIDQPILYTVNAETGKDGYENSGRVGSRGVEVEVQLRGAHGFVRAGYSFAQASPDTTVDTYLLPDTKGRLLGMPGHKLTALGHLRLPGGFSLNTSGWFISERSGYSTTGALAAFPQTLILNVNAHWEAPEATLLRGLFATVGASNLFDQQLTWLQPYNGGHPPMPGRGRDLFVRLGYSVSL